MTEPRLLILETSSRVAQVALAEGAVLRGVRRLDEARRHARDLAPAVAELLAAQGWRPRDLHAVVVGRGPGSYTGLRVGVMSAKAFAYASGCAVLAAKPRRAPTSDPPWITCSAPAPCLGCGRPALNSQPPAPSHHGPVGTAPHR